LGGGGGGGGKEEDTISERRRKGGDRILFYGAVGEKHLFPHRGGRRIDLFPWKGCLERCLRRYLTERDPRKREKWGENVPREGGEGEKEEESGGPRKGAVSSRGGGRGDRPEKRGEVDVGEG